MGEHVPEHAAQPAAEVPARVGVIEDDPKRPWKAIAAALTPALVALVYAILPGSDGGSSITGLELGGLVTALGLTGGVTYKVRNPMRNRDLGPANRRRGNDWE